jgi:hypothetical protein
LIDLLTTYLPTLTDFYGGGSLGSPDLFAYMMRAPRWWWSVLRGVEDQAVLKAALFIWIGATVFVLIGLWTRFSVAVVWLLSTSFGTINPYIENAGDQVRGIILFYLLLTPCGAVWSLDRLRQRSQQTCPILIHPWALRLLFVQMTLIYFFNGLYKLDGVDWSAGTSLYYVLGDLTLARWSYAQLPVPFVLTQVLSWIVLVWEVSFPLWMLLPWLAVSLIQPWLPVGLGVGLVRFLRGLRLAALILGVLFHLGILLTMEIGLFAPYMLCLYLPLVPWEKWRKEEG